MPRAYDNDLRRKVLAAHAAGNGSQRELAELFGVSQGWVEKVSRQQRQSGQADRVEQRHGSVSRVDSAAQACLLRAIEDRPDRTLRELQQVLAEQQGVRLGIAQVWNVLKRLGVRLKKSLHATGRDTEANRRKREEFVERIRAVSPERLIFLDESGVTTSMTRLYERHAGGRRIHESTPCGNWKILTVLAALRLSGVNAAMTIEEATDFDIFLAYVEHVLCPTLAIGDVVVMDNLSSHKVKGVRELIQARGAEVLYPPPYSPDLNPIEKAWAKIKQYLRSTRARSKEDLEQAIADAIALITADHAQAWFRHALPALQQL